MPKCDVFFINLMGNNDHTVPKRYVNINSLMKKYHILTENEVERQISRSTYGLITNILVQLAHIFPLVIHRDSLKFAFQPHFLLLSLAFSWKQFCQCKQDLRKTCKSYYITK
jgi:hypothetical protein